MAHDRGVVSWNSLTLPLDSRSANMEPSSEHLVILSIVTVQPIAAATLPMAFTKVVHSAHLVL